MDQESEKIQLDTLEQQSIVEQRLHSFIESANEAMLLLDEQGVIILLNELAQQKTGYQTQELIGKHVEVLIPVLTNQTYSEGHMYQFAPHRRLGMNKDLKMFVSRKDGVEFPAKITFSSMNINDEIYLPVSIQASSDNEIVEQRVHQHERILKETQRIAKIASWEWDAVTKEFFYSDNFYNIVHVDPEMVISKYDEFIELVHEDDRDYVQKAFQKAINEGGRYSVHYRFVMQDNSVVDVHDEGIVDYDADGVPVRMIGFIQDITERHIAETALKRYAAELKEANDLAQAAIDAKSKFLATMSHELRTPLNGVIGMASLLEGTPLDEEQRDYVQTIYYSGDALLTIINDILDYAKLDAGALDISMRPFNLKDCINELVKAFFPVAQNKGLELLTFVTEDVPELVLGDERRVKQVLINLLSNALKFTQKGVIEVIASVTNQTQHGYQLKFSVLDTGIGIPDQKLHHLFGLFEQVDGSYARQFGGTGLGLAICKRLITLMNGEIGVESSHSGSTFWFTLSTPNVEMHEAKRSRVPTRNEYVIIFSQNEILGEKLKRWLDSLGMKTEFFQDVNAFIDALKVGTSIDQVIIDIEALGDQYKAIGDHVKHLKLYPLFLLPSNPDGNVLPEGSKQIKRPVALEELIDQMSRNWNTIGIQ